MVSPYQTNKCHILPIDSTLNSGHILIHFVKQIKVGKGKNEMSFSVVGERVTTYTENCARCLKHGPRSTPSGRTHTNIPQKDFLAAIKIRIYSRRKKNKKIGRTQDLNVIMVKRKTFIHIRLTSTTWHT